MYNEITEDFSSYIEYLDSIKHKISQSIYDFASDIGRHNFDKRSLHDSWLKNLKVETNFETRYSDINIVLLGAYHDREFYLNFKEVRQYKISQSLQDIDRDLLAFEIKFEPNAYNENQLVFRALFSGNENEIEIFCNDMEIEENKIN